MDIKILQNTPPWEWPAKVDRLFHKILTDPSAKAPDRLIAADLAGDLVAVNDTLAHDLLALAPDASQSVQLRATAAISLGPVLEQAYTFGFDDPEEVPITELTFLEIKDSLHRLYLDTSLPKELRRRILEASVRAPDDWHPAAIQDAYSTGDRDWKLTAVFCMRHVRGFNAQILEALQSGDEDIHYEAVEAAGNWEVAGAWSHLVALIEDASTVKPLLVAAIEAVSSIRPLEARETLEDLLDSDDEEIAEAAEEAIAMAETVADVDDEDDAKWIN